MIKIINCDCPHEYQDKRYGKGRRAANTTEQGARCTVCAKTHTASAKAAKAEAAAEKKK